jgi:hypothetical protein
MRFSVILYVDSCERNYTRATGNMHLHRNSSEKNWKNSSAYTSINAFFLASGNKIHVFATCSCKKAVSFLGKSLILCNERGPYLTMILIRVNTCQIRDEGHFYVFLCNRGSNIENGTLLQKGHFPLSVRTRCTP